MCQTKKPSTKRRKVHFFRVATLVETEIFKNICFHLLRYGHIWITDTLSPFTGGNTVRTYLKNILSVRNLWAHLAYPQNRFSSKTAFCIYCSICLFSHASFLSYSFFSFYHECQLSEYIIKIFLWFSSLEKNDSML